MELLEVWSSMEIIARGNLRKPWPELVVQGTHHVVPISPYAVITPLAP